MPAAARAPGRIPTMSNDDYFDPDEDERDDLRAQAHDERLSTPFFGAGCRPACAQCTALLPLYRVLDAGGWRPYLETQLGGGMHAIHVTLDGGAYALLNDEGFTIYRDEDDEGSRSMTFSTDDPPNVQQQVTLFRLEVELWRLATQPKHPGGAHA